MARLCCAWRSKLIEINQNGRVLEITLNRPEKRNALNRELCRDIVLAVDRADESLSAGAIMLAAKGKVFSSGMDLKESVETNPEELNGLHESLFGMIQRVRKPIIAAVEGPALAGGVGLIANAHIVLCHPDAHFALTEIRVGLWPVLIFRAVKQAIGERRAVELSLTGREFSAREAYEYGLVTEISDDPLRRAMQIASDIAARSPMAVSAGLDYVRQIRNRDWADGGRIGWVMRQDLLASADYHEGVKAFAEKRKPVWPSLQE